MEVLNSKQDYQSSIKVGPWGGVGGAPWNYMANGGIVEITINHEGIINSLSFKSVCANKEEKCSRNFGLKRGKTTKISIDWPEEYLTSISGTYTRDRFIVESLTCYRGLSKGSYFNSSIIYGPKGNYTLNWR
ncbi:hypothetical protein Q3G72_000873 [Acer saccharum]|nr:hypothetical protein Q3G72_000873 [Acer saccharum]